MKRWQTFLRRLGMAAGAAMIVAAGAGAAPGSTTVGVVSMALQTDPATSIALTYTSASGVANSALVTAQLLDSAGRPTTNGGAALQIMFDSGLGGQLNTPPGTSSQSLGLGSCTGPGPAGAGYTNPQTGAIQCELTMSQAGSVDLTASLGASANQIPELTLIPAATTITQVAAGAYQGLAVTSAGRVLGWGNNGLGELGDGNEVSTGTPVPAILPNGTDVTSLAAGGYFTLALTSQGTVLAWGDDGVGQLGNGEVDRLGLDLPTSVQLPSGTVVTQVAAGCNHALALTSTGAVWGWGTDSSGQLGNGKFTKVDDVPVQADTSAIPGRIVQIAAGCNHTLALTSDGAVFAWGTGHFGQLGDGSTTPEPLPVQVKIPSNLKIIQVSGGSFSSYALAAGTTNQVLAWGQGGVGQLGDGKTKNSDLPVYVQIPSGVNVSSISGGGFNGAALTTTGQVLGWGANYVGQLGDGTSVNRLTPVYAKIPTGIAISSISSAGAGGFQTSALATNGQVYSWGGNYNGQLGDGVITAGYHTAAVTSSGIVLAWGDNRAGELANGLLGGSSDDPVATQVPDNWGAVAVAAGCADSFAVSSQGAALAWGANSDGQLGTGFASLGVSDPTAVELPAGVAVKQISPGCVHTLAVTSTGGVLAWGANDQGELGNGSTVGSEVPVGANLPAGTVVTSVAAGCDFSLALTDTGQVYAWGANSEGQLGDGSLTSTGTPHLVALPANTQAQSIAAGCQHAVVLTTAGQVLAWGSNKEGQLGRATPALSDTPLSVSLPSGDTGTAIGAGLENSAALTSTGAILTWGYNADGQLGNGTFLNSVSPVTVNLPQGTAVTTMAIGGNEGMVRTETDKVYGWGSNFFGELGDGANTTSASAVPTLIPSGTVVAQLATGGYENLEMLSPTTMSSSAWVDVEVN